MLSLEDYFRNSQQTGFQLSPDGRRLAFLAPYCGRMNVFVTRVDVGSAGLTSLADAVRLTDERERSVAGFFWKGDDRLFFVKDDGGDENFHLFSIGLDGEGLRCLTPFAGVRASVIDDLEDDPSAMIVGLNRRNAEVFDPYRLDIESGELTLLAENPGNWQGWMTDHDGRLRVVYAIVDGVNTQILYRDTEDEDFRPVATMSFREELNFCMFTPDNRRVYAVTNVGRDKSALVVIAPSQPPPLGEESEGADGQMLPSPPPCSASHKSDACQSKNGALGGESDGADGQMLPSPPPRSASRKGDACQSKNGGSWRGAVESWRGALFAHDRYDVCSISYSRRRRKLLSVYCTGHREPVRHFFDDDARELRQRLEGHFPGKRVGIADTDRSEERMLVFVGSDRTRGAYWLYDRPTDTLQLVAELAPWIGEDDTVPMEAVTYTTSDGLTIEAYLSRPRSAQRGLVVIPHGGPWTRDTWGYNSEVQFLCSRGYAVFQMNFRGSTGYGRRFLEAGYKQWGLRMQDDITEGVEWLISEGIAERGRIAIYGGSYGGYATLAGACFTPDLYCCAVDYVGVSNLLTFMDTIPPYWRPMLEMMHEQVGDPERDREQLEATSPALHADRIKCPLFIAQGANDPRVNKAESDQMVEALRRRGIEVEYMVKDDEGHGFHNEENRFDFYRAMERFLDKYLGPPKPPSNSPR